MNTKKYNKLMKLYYITKKYMKEHNVKLVELKNFTMESIRYHCYMENFSLSMWKG